MTYRTMKYGVALIDFGRQPANPKAGAISSGIRPKENFWLNDKSRANCRPE